MSERVAGTPPTLSTDLTKRIDLRDPFETVLQTSPGILSLLRTDRRELYGQNNRLFWMEDVHRRESTTVNNAGVVAVGDTDFIVTEAAIFDVGMVIKFGPTLETLTVTNVNTATNTLTVTRETNGVTAVQVADGVDVIVVNRPEEEYSRAHEVGTYRPTEEYNLYETFREDIPFSERIKDSREYGFQNGQEFMDYNIEKWLRKLSERLNRSLLYNNRSETSPTTMRGIYVWLTQAGAISTDASGDPLTAPMVNTLLSNIWTSDTNINSLVLFMDAVQARVMAGFNTTLANRLEKVGFNERAAAGNTYKTVFIPDLQAVGLPPIIVDKSAQAGTIAALNMDKIKLVYAPNGQPIQWDSKAGDMHPDALRQSIMMTCSLEMVNHTESHGLIRNLQQTL